MLYEKGLAALRLNFTDRVYRTEYSVFDHSALLSRVTGVDYAAQTTDKKLELQRRFAAEWDYCLTWNTLISSSYLGKYVTKMGHGTYAEGGTDLDFDTRELFSEPDEVFSFDPAESLPSYSKAGLTDAFNKSYRSSAGWIPDAVAMTGSYITCMSGLIDMLGWNMLLLCAGEDSRRFGEFTNRYSKWAEQFFYAAAECDSPVIMVHDDIVWTEGPFLAPEWYRKYIFPHYKKFFDILHGNGKRVLFTSDGNYTSFIDDIAACGADCFVLEPLTDMSYIAQKYGKTHAFIGNADTRVLLYGSRDDIFAEVKRCMDIGKRCPGFIMAVGNHIPSNTPVDSCLWYDEACKLYGKR